MISQRSVVLGVQTLFRHSRFPTLRNLSSAAGELKFRPDSFKDLAITVPKPFVYQVELNRPSKYNAISQRMWAEVKQCFEQLSHEPDCRVIVVSAAGKHFTAGIDLSSMAKLGEEISEIDDIGRKGVFLNKRIKMYQDGFTALELCNKPVIAAVHSACIGAGVDLITAADIRYCTQDAWFQVKEVDIGMAADVGTLQRLPKVVGNQSLVRELCFTARKMHSDEASSCGLVGKVFDNKDAMMTSVIELAAEIASKSPIAVQATKKNIVYSQNRTNQEGLDQIREMNQLFLQSEDFATAVFAQISKGEKPEFSKL